MRTTQNIKMTLILALNLCVLSSIATASSYKLDTAHTDIGFSVKHLMLSNIKGRFKKFDGEFQYDEKTKTVNNIDIKIDATSIDTNNLKRDEHLMSADFFEANKNPLIEFKANKVSGLSPGKKIKVPGILTMKGVLKPITLTVDFLGTTVDPTGTEKIVFSATTKIQRKNWGINWNKTLDKGGVAVGEEVVVDIDSEANKTK